MPCVLTASALPPRKSPFMQSMDVPRAPARYLSNIVCTCMHVRVSPVQRVIIGTGDSRAADSRAGDRF
jgi:hypothetical protein